MKLSARNKLKGKIIGVKKGVTIIKASDVMVGVD
jgi:molybdopterin-binding protein